MPTLPLTPAEIAVALALVFAGSVVQGTIGFGLAVVAAPILLLLDPLFVPGPMLLAAMLLVILVALRERRDVIGQDIAVATLGRALGTVPAAYAIGALPPEMYEILFAALVALAVVLSLSGLRINRTPANVFLASVVSGIAGTVSAVGGPPMALVYQHEAGPKIRGTLSAIFTIGTLISIIGLWWAGRFGAVELTLGLLMMPAVVLGFLTSRYTAGRLDRGHTRPALLTISIISVLAIVIRAWL